MKKTIITIATAISTLVGGGIYYEDYMASTMDQAETKIAEGLLPSFEYQYNGYTVNVKRHWIKKEVLWIDLEARKGAKMIDLDTPYGYANINITNGDDKVLAFKDMVHATIVMQDAPEFQTKFKQIKKEREFRKPNL